MMRNPKILALAASLVCACGTPADETAVSEGPVVAELSREAFGVLGFLNGPAATLETLDVDAGLDVRAARNIVGHVRGWDGALGTVDDDLLETMAELDAIAYVGASALEKLVAYVTSIGAMPDLVVEDVPLTHAQASAIVALANSATEGQLDVDVGLDARAASGIVAARPLADIQALARVSYVGTSAIAKLRDAVALSVTTYDLGADWSNTRNPMGPWTLSEGGRAIAASVADWDGIQGQAAWAVAAHPLGHVPAFMKVAVAAPSSPAWDDAKVGDILVHSQDDSSGPEQGEAAIVWTSPAKGTIDIDGGVWLARSIGRSNRWSLRVASVEVAAGVLADGDAYARTRPLAFAAVARAGALSNLSVAAGDEVVLTVTQHEDSPYGEFTGVNLVITLTAAVGEAPTSSDAGCADGQREGFTDVVAYPEIAGCSGAWSVPGILSPVDPACGRRGGDDGLNSRGIGCNSSDLCAAGWHICSSALDVADHSPTGCTGATVASDPAMFFSARQSGPGSGSCGAGANDLFGCGNLGDAPWSDNCAPLDRFSHDQCSSLGAPWSCCCDGEGEANSVTKSGAAGGGVLCCRDLP